MVMQHLPSNSETLQMHLEPYSTILLLMPKHIISK